MWVTSWICWVSVEFTASGSKTAADGGCDCGWTRGSMWACDVCALLRGYLLPPHPPPPTPQKDGSSITDPDCCVLALGCALLEWSLNVMRTRHALHLGEDRSACCLCWHLPPWIHTAPGRVRMRCSDLHAQMSRWCVFVCARACVLYEYKALQPCRFLFLTCAWTHKWRNMFPSRGFKQCGCDNELCMHALCRIAPCIMYDLGDIMVSNK